MAVVHQFTGWFVFRTQLVYSLFTRLFGKHDLLAWGVIFTPLLLLRPLLVIGLSLAEAGCGGPTRAVDSSSTTIRHVNPEQLAGLLTF